MYFISAAVILLASLALTVHVSLPHNKTGRAGAFYIPKINVQQYITIFGDDPKHWYGGCLVSKDNRKQGAGSKEKEKDM